MKLETVVTRVEEMAVSMQLIWGSDQIQNTYGAPRWKIFFISDQRFPSIPEYADPELLLPSSIKLFDKDDISDAESLLSAVRGRPKIER